MSTQINWKGESKPRVLYFKDLKVNDHFMIVSPSSKGAVYKKIQISASSDEFDGLGSEYFQLEIATGIAFDATLSPVEIVDVIIDVDAEKPNLPNY